MSATEEAVILPPDKTLLRKVGGVNLDIVLSPKAIEKAQAIIANASEELYLDCVSASVKLLAAASLIESSQNLGSKIQKIIPLAFIIKNEAAQSGYDLISTLAESLQKTCETLDVEAAKPSDLRIILWHAESIVKLLTLKVKANGGEIGEEIMAEIEKLGALAYKKAKRSA